MPRRLLAEVDVILHETEDVPRLLEELCGLLRISPEAAVQTGSSGHYGNQITMVHAELAKKDAESLLGALVRGLGEEQVRQVIDGMGLAVSSSGLHIRLDKQEAACGRLSLQDGGAVRVRLYIPVYVKKEATAAYAALLGDSLKQYSKDSGTPSRE